MLRIWPASLVALGIVGMTLPAAVTRFAPMDLGERNVVVNGERHVTLTGWDQSDYAILQRMPDIVQLQMANPDVTDETLRSIRDLQQIKVLDIARSGVTDAGLQNLSKLKSLQKLFLAGTKITDDGLGTVLEQLPELQSLDVRETSITPQLLRTWKQSKVGRKCLPNPPMEVVAPESSVP